MFIVPVPGTDNFMIVHSSHRFRNTNTSPVEYYSTCTWYLYGKRQFREFTVLYVDYSSTQYNTTHCTQTVQVQKGLDSNLHKRFTTTHTGSKHFDAPPHCESNACWDFKERSALKASSLVSVGTPDIKKSPQTNKMRTFVLLE